MGAKLTDEQIELTEFIKKLCDLEDDELNDWETEFVEKLSHLPVQSLSPKQVDLIRRLYNERC